MFGAAPVLMGESNEFGQLIECARFGEISIGAKPVGAHDILLNARATQHHDRDDAMLRMLADPFEHFQPAAARHFYVGDDNGRDRKFFAMAPIHGRMINRPMKYSSQK